MNGVDWRRAPATVALTLATLAVSLLILADGALAPASLGAGVIAARFDGAVLPPGLPALVPTWLTPLSSTLVHGGLAHLAFNLVMLAFCGVQAERAVGAGGIVVLYVAGAYAAAAGQWLIAPASPVPVIGASGAISAVVAAYALFFGRREARSVGPVPARAVTVAWLAAGWVGVQLLVGLAGAGVPGAGGAGVAIGAHIGGFAAGLLLANPLLRWRWRGA